MAGAAEHRGYGPQYRVSARPRRWLEFDLPANAVGLRLLTNAALANTSLPPISPDRPRRGWNYAVDFELLDDQLETLQQRRYHLRSRISHGQNAGTEVTEGQTWFQDSQLVPAQTRTVQIPLRQFDSRAHRLRVRLGARDDQVQDVAMRLYFKYERPDYEQPYAWSRLSLDARQRICRASVYPPDLLSPWERRNLLHWDWTALPPLGRIDVDYQYRLIYQREDPQVENWELQPPPEGIVCRAEVPVTIPTPAEVGVVRLEVYPDYAMDNVFQAMVDVRVHRKLLGQVAHYRQAAGGSSELLQFDTAGDLLEVTASEDVVCVATWRPSAEGAAAATDTAITLSSSAETIRAQLTDKIEPLDYEITHVDQLPTPFRVTLRRLLPCPAATVETRRPAQLATATVAYEFLDDRGDVLRRGTLETLPDVARYDVASIGAAPMWVTEPSTSFFSVPLAATKVRFRCEHSDVAVIAFTRPRDLARTFRIPEEQGIFEQQQENGRTWFLIRPSGYQQRVADNRVADIALQTRPQPPHERLISGQYEWDDHRPREFSPGRFVLTQRDPSFALRDEAIASAYSQVPVDTVVSFRWMTEDVAVPIEPRLMYLVPAAAAGLVQVFIDDALYHQFIPARVVVKSACRLSPIHLNPTHCGLSRPSAARSSCGTSNCRTRPVSPKGSSTNWLSMPCRLMWSNIRRTPNSWCCVRSSSRNSRNRTSWNKAMRMSGRNDSPLMSAWREPRRVKTGRYPAGVWSIAFTTSHPAATNPRSCSGARRVGSARVNRVS